LCLVFPKLLPDLVKLRQLRDKSSYPRPAVATRGATSSSFRWGAIFMKFHSMT